MSPASGSAEVGTSAGLTMTVWDEVVLAAPPERVWEIVRHGDLVSHQFPLFLRLGFPLPTRIERDGAGRVHLTFDPGSEPWPGSNVMAWVPATRRSNPYFAIWW